MAKRDRTQAALDQLAEAVEDPHSKPAAAAISKALRSRSNLVIAAALAVIREHELTGFEDAMRAAFAGAMVDPVHSDPGCRTKIGVVRALDALREPDDELFLSGIRHVQKEPAWGGSHDTAASLRGMCAMALVNRNHPDAMFELARLLGDPEREARRAAADAVAASGDVLTGVPLLVLRVRSNESESEVLGACFGGLLSLDDARAFEFVVEHLHARDPIVVEAAALALGQERPEGALTALRELAERGIGDLRRVAMLAIAMLRSEDAWTLLLDHVRNGTPGLARDAIEALSVYRELGDLRQRVREAVGEREAVEGRGGNRAVEQALAEFFRD
jgi:HEAT repeat protein